MKSTGATDSAGNSLQVYHFHLVSLFSHSYMIGCHSANIDYIHFNECELLYYGYIDPGDIKFCRTGMIMSVLTCTETNHRLFKTHFVFDKYLF